MNTDKASPQNRGRIFCVLTIAPKSGALEATKLPLPAMES